MAQMFSLSKRMVEGDSSSVDLEEEGRSGCLLCPFVLLCPFPASLGGEGGLCAGPHRLSRWGGSSSRGRFLMVMRLWVRVTPGGFCSPAGGNPE